MSAGVVLAFPKEQHPAGVTARRARRRRLAGQTLAVARWPGQKGAGVRQWRGETVRREVRGGAVTAGSCWRL